jgi:uncharacterized protein (TIRG00374 family)
MRFSKLFSILLLFCGLVLLVAMVRQMGLSGLLTSVQSLGWWLFPYLLLKLVPTLLDAMAWAACFSGPRLPTSFWRLLLVSQAGRAINRVTPTADLGGDVTRTLLLAPAMPQSQALATVVIDKASITLAKMVYLALGLLYVMQHLRLPAELTISLSLTIGLISLGLIGFVASQRYGLLSRLCTWLGRFGIGRQKFQRFSQHLNPLDAHLVAYHTRHPWRFAGSWMLHFAAYSFAIVKIYVLLRLLMGQNAPNFSEAIIITVAVTALDQLFFFVPGRVGTLEAVRFMVLSAVGVEQIYGLAFGLVARLEQLVWCGIGMLAYAYCSRGSQGATEDRRTTVPSKA